MYLTLREELNGGERKNEKQHQNVREQTRPFLHTALLTFNTVLIYPAVVYISSQKL